MPKRRIQKSQFIHNIIADCKNIVTMFGGIDQRVFIKEFLRTKHIIDVQPLPHGLAHGVIKGDVLPRM